MSRPGSVWVESCSLRYVDQNGTVRQFTGANQGTVPGQVPGSVWVQGDNIHFICQRGHRHVLYWRYVSGADGVAGSAWIDGPEVRYRDQNRIHRAVCTQCETMCEDACQIACKTTCQAYCRTACQYYCQTTCQISCQTFQ